MYKKKKHQTLVHWKLPKIQIFHIYTTCQLFNFHELELKANQG